MTQTSILQSAVNIFNDTYINRLLSSARKKTAESERKKSLNIIQSANYFIKRKLKNKVNFDTICEYLRTIGYAVIFYNSDKDNEILNKYDLTEFSKTVKAFTVFRKDLHAVFIDENSTCVQRLCSILHEVAHIELNHINEKNIKDSRIMEMESEFFAYHLLNYVSFIG
jgi:Zn-dependent peptidase ImmA (M78 family)